ncbi:MAG: hypothetical protein KME45_24110 [Stenomitos rutilans HA7619-LM2]|jgi:hypothetical protein|nr:hypothetical protein [Stenomitos rutilans HA7619-LM2]
MTHRGEVLVVVMNNPSDWAIACFQHWYRIPIAPVETLKQQGYWPPRWLAFYQTKVFGAEAYAINYYAHVNQIREAYHWELFPDNPREAKSEHRYCKLELSPLEPLPQPIVSQRLRRVSFIATTWEQFQTATSVEALLSHQRSK